MDVFPKFVIEDGNLIIQKCTYHKQIVTDPTKVRGGGWFRYDNDNRRFIFHGESTDFGRASIEDIRKCVQEKRVFSNKSCIRNLAEDHTFAYDTGSEIIDL